MVRWCPDGTLECEVSRCARVKKIESEDWDGKKKESISINMTGGG